jgi:flagellar hook-associated protein 2
MSASSSTQPGTYAVNVTQAASTPTATGNAIAGTYGNAAVADTMKVVDSYTGKTSTISLVDNDTASTIASKLNVAFGTDGLRLVASVVNGDQLKIDGLQYGSLAAFTVDFLEGVASAGPQLGFAATAYAGTNVAGTVNGFAATGSGQLLTASINANNPAQGLSVLYTGTNPPETANISYVLGLGGGMHAVTTALAEPGVGTIASMESSIQGEIDSLSSRAGRVQQRLAAERTSLTSQFTAMETALSKLQSQASALTNQINALQPSGH